MESHGRNHCIILPAIQRKYNDAVSERREDVIKMALAVYVLLGVVILVIRNSLMRAEKYFKFYARNPIWETDFLRGCERLGEAQVLSIVGMIVTIGTTMELYGIPEYQEIESVLRVACGTMTLTTVQVCFLAPKRCISYFKKVDERKIILTYTKAYTISTAVAIVMVALFLKLMEG